MHLEGYQSGDNASGGVSIRRQCIVKEGSAGLHLHCNYDYHRPRDVTRVTSHDGGVFVIEYHPPRFNHHYSHSLGKEVYVVYRGSCCELIISGAGQIDFHNLGSEYRWIRRQDGV